MKKKKPTLKTFKLESVTPTITEKKKRKQTKPPTILHKTLGTKLETSYNQAEESEPSYMLS